MSQRSHRFTGFTLIETMISVCVISVGLLGVLSFISTLHASRGMANDVVRSNAFVQAMVDRIQGASWSQLATSQLPWSQPRYEDSVTGDQDPMQESDLIAYGLIQQPLGLPDLKVYLEYYRAISLKDENGIPLVGAKGLTEDDSVTSTATSRELFKNSAKRALFRLGQINSAGLNDESLLGKDDPVLIRIRMTWSPNRTFEVITGRKR